VASSILVWGGRNRMPSKGGTIYSNLATLIYGRVSNRDYDTSPRICPLVDLIYTGFITTRGRGLLDSKKCLPPHFTRPAQDKVCNSNSVIVMASRDSFSDLTMLR
jgi:hypothetical protein